MHEPGVKAKQIRTPVAQAKTKKKKQDSPWLKRFLLFVIVPLFVWFLAFLIWFNWTSIEKLFSKANLEDRSPTKASRKSERVEKPEKTDRNEKASRQEEPATEEKTESPRPRAEPRPAETKEKILDEDRKKLEDILKAQR